MFSNRFSYMPKAFLICGTIFVAGGALSACAPGRDLTPLPPYNPASYTIGVGDRIHVSTFGENDFQADQKIPIDGNLTFPLIGSVPAAGQTASHLADMIASRLQKNHVLHDAKVTVQIEEYRPVSVIGEVEHGGQFAYQPGMTMLSAVAAAGGFSYRAFSDYAYVVRQQAGKSVIGRLDPQDYVKPNDVIRIYERHF